MHRLCMGAWPGPHLAEEASHPCGHESVPAPQNVSERRMNVYE